MLNIWIPYYDILNVFFFFSYWSKCYIIKIETEKLCSFLFKTTKIDCCWFLKRKKNLFLSYKNRNLRIFFAAFVKKKSLKKVGREMFPLNFTPNWFSVSFVVLKMGIQNLLSKTEISQWNQHLIDLVFTGDSYEWHKAMRESLNLQIIVLNESSRRRKPDKLEDPNSKF